MKRSIALRASWVLAFAVGAAFSSSPLFEAALRAAGPPSGETTAWFAIYPAESGGRITVAIESNGGGIQGWSYGVCHDPSAARLKTLDLSPELSVVNRGAPPDFIALDEAVPERNGGRAGFVQAIVLAYYEALFLPVRSGGFPVADAEYEIIGGATSTLATCAGLVGRGQPVPVALAVRGRTVCPSRPAQATLTPSAENTWFAMAPAVTDSEVRVSIDWTNAQVSGWSLGVCHDPSAAELDEFRTADELAALLAGLPASFVQTEEASGAASAGVVQAVALFDPQRSVALPARPGGFPVLELSYSATRETFVHTCEGLVGSEEPVALVLTVEDRSEKPSKPAGATLIPKTPSSQLAFRTEPPESSEIVTVTISTGALLAQGWSFALCNGASASQVVEYQASPELGRLVDGEGPGFLLDEVVSAGPYTALTQRVILGSPMEPVALGPFEDFPVLNVRYRVSQDDSLKFCDQDPLGTVKFENQVTVDGVAYVPWLRRGSRLLRATLGTTFIRGDADLNRAVQLTDAVYTLAYLFMGGEELPCLDAADANDVGRVDISDPIFVLTYLFLGGPEPPPPFPEPGEDLSPQTALGCERGL
ncbi:MAG: hypothetical protein ACUVYA_00025 [Planctomycetota bacterium]